MVVGLLAGLVPLLPVERAVADDAVVTDCTEASFDTALATVQGSGGGTITFSCSGAIPFSGEKTITSYVTILGGGSVSFDGQDTTRLFVVSGSATLELDGLTLQNGNAGVGHGGAIFNDSGTLTVTASTFSGNNTAASGGAIFNDGTLTVVASTFSGNHSASASGGAIFNHVGRTLTVMASTFSDNSATNIGGIIVHTGGGAIFNNGGTLTVTASTFSGNSAIHVGTSVSSGGGALYNNFGMLTVTATTFSDNSATNLGGAIFNIGTGTVALQSTTLANSTGDNCVNVAPGLTTSNGYNLSDDASCNLTAAGDVPNSASVNLGPLQDNGGPTRTMLPQAGSDALEAIPPVACATLSSAADQRGVSRPQGTNCEIGAVEVEAQPVQPVTLCANRYTGQLAGLLATGSCPAGSNALALPAPTPVTLCVNPYTGALIWAPRGTCGAGYRTHIVPTSGPLNYCQNIYTGKLRYSATGACSAGERADVIAGA
jgi:predicted outer membrane repeat protein